MAVGVKEGELAEKVMMGGSVLIVDCGRHAVYEVGNGGCCCSSFRCCLVCRGEGGVYAGGGGVVDVLAAARRVLLSSGTWRGKWRG